MKVPDFADCTDQTDPSHVDTPDGFNALVCSQENSQGFHGHLNWFAVTFDGNATWGDHNSDDDYYIALKSPGAPGLVNQRNEMHTEFDSDETIDNFRSNWWNNFHDVIDHDKGKRYLNGQHTIMTGLFGVDCEHDCKSELHPVYAMAANTWDDPRDDTWGMFVRNAGDEGYCSRQIWEAPFTTYTFRLPWRAGTNSVEVLSGPFQTEFLGTSGTSGPIVTYMPGQWVDVTFTLPPPSAAPLIDGALHLRWSNQTTVRGTRRERAVVDRAELLRREGLDRTLVATRAPSVKMDDETEELIRAAMEKLSPAQRRQVQIAAGLPVRPLELHRLLVASARVATAVAAAPRVAVRLGAKGPVASRKLERDSTQLRALCTTAAGRPPGLLASICSKVQRPIR